MTKISRASSLKSSRIRSNFVNRLTTPQQVEEIEPLSPAVNLQNKTAYSRENQLLNYDIYYEKMKELKKEFKNFYRKKLALEKAINNLDTIRQSPADSLETLIDKYNETLLSLEGFDEAAGTNLANKIKEIPLKYKAPLQQVGIELIDNKLMNLDKDFWTHANNYIILQLNLLFTPRKGMIAQLLQAFQTITINKGSLPFDMRGLVIDDKS